MPPLFACHTAFHQLVMKATDGVADSTPSLLVTMIAVVSALAAFGATYMIFRIKPNFRRYDPASYEPKWRGLKGGVLVLAIAIVVEMARTILQTRCLPTFFAEATWRALTHESADIGHPMFGVIICLNAAAIGIRLGWIPMIVNAFIRRRRSLRWLVLGYLLLMLLLLMTNDMLMHQFLDSHDDVIFQNFQSLGQTMTACVLICPYLFMSRRMNATFST